MIHFVNIYMLPTAGASFDLNSQLLTQLDNGELPTYE